MRLPRNDVRKPLFGTPFTAHTLHLLPKVHQQRVAERQIACFLIFFKCPKTYPFTWRQNIVGFFSSWVHRCWKSVPLAPLDKPSPMLRPSCYESCSLGRSDLNGMLCTTSELPPKAFPLQLTQKREANPRGSELSFHAQNAHLAAMVKTCYKLLVTHIDAWLINKSLLLTQMASKQNPQLPSRGAHKQPEKAALK